MLSDGIAQSDVLMPGLWRLWRICVWLLCIWSCVAQGQPATLDYQVKAAMLYKFLGYTDWPETAFVAPEAPYRICILGAHNIETELIGLVAGRTINGRGIEITFANRVDQVGDAHLVFIARAQESLLPGLARAAEKRAYLLVTENEAGLTPASAINLRLLNGRVGFDISLVNAQKAGLKFSSRLLAVAVNVQDAQRP